MVHQAAGRCHHDLAAFCQLTGLLVHICAAINADDLHLGHKVHQLCKLCGDLLGQLSGGCQDHSLRHLAVRVDLLHHRDAECAGLTGAGGRLGDHIPPCHHDRDRLFLHFGHLGKAHALHGFADSLGTLQLAV